MSEYPGDDSTPIPFVKIYGELQVAPAPTVHVGEDVFLLVELINMGTASSQHGDTLTGFLTYQNGVIHQESIDYPEIGANGSTWRHMFKFDGHYVMTDGEWEMGAMVTLANTIGEVQDDKRITFTVSPRES
jgi:hypothetical protein